MKPRASQITVDPAGLAVVTSTDVQGAIAELDTASGAAGYTDEQVRDVIGAALVAGTGITITPNDGADTITIAASGGGGGPTTAEYLTTAADATLSAERVVDLGAYSLLTRRAAANTEDDHFNATSLDAKWLAYTGYNPSTDLTALLGWCKFTSDGAKLQAVPAGDWSIETEVVLGSTTGAQYEDVGLILTNGTNVTGTDARFGIGMANALNNFRLVWEKFTNNAFVSAYGQWTGLGPPNDHMFLRYVKSGTTYSVDWSTTGQTWQRWATTSSLGFTPTHFGLQQGSGNPSYFNYFLRY